MRLCQTFLHCCTLDLMLTYAIGMKYERCMAEDPKNRSKLPNSEVCYDSTRYIHINTLDSVSLIWIQNIRLPTFERVTRRARDFHCVNIRRISSKIKTLRGRKIRFFYNQGMHNYTCILYDYLIIILS